MTYREYFNNVLSANISDEMNEVSEQSKNDPFFDEIDPDERYAEQFEEIMQYNQKDYIAYFVQSY